MFQNSPQLDGVIESVGVDWITATCNSSRRSSVYEGLAHVLLLKERALGNDVSTYAGLGYVGRTCGGVSFGRRHDGVIIQLRSELAREHFKPVAKSASNISRLDVQYTVRLAQPQPDFFHTAYYARGHVKKMRGRGVDVSLKVSEKKGDGIYIGARSSDKYGRAYDKGMDEKTDAKGHLIRLEAEFKNAYANHWATKLIRTKKMDALAGAIVNGFFKPHGIPVSTNFNQKREVLTTQVSDDNRRLRWLSNNVRPTVERLTRKGELNQVIHALGLCYATERNCTRCHQDLSNGKEQKDGCDL